MSGSLDARTYENLKWFYDQEQAVLNSPRKIAYDAGFYLKNMGNRHLAFYQDFDDKICAYYLITTDDGTGVEADPNDKVWTASLYAEFEGDTRWTLVSEPMTLPELLERYRHIPMPVYTREGEDLERVIERWDDCMPTPSTPSL